MATPNLLSSLALPLIGLLSLVGCESPLLGEWQVDEARGVGYPIEEGGEACTTTVTADMDIRERSEGLGGNYYERTNRACFEQDISDKLTWDVVVEEVERGLWIIDLESDDSDNVSLECQLEDESLTCEDDSDDGGDWVFIRVEEED